MQVEQSMYQTSNQALKLAIEAQNQELQHSRGTSVCDSIGEELKEFDQISQEFETDTKQKPGPAATKDWESYSHWLLDPLREKREKASQLGLSGQYQRSKKWLERRKPGAEGATQFRNLLKSPSNFAYTFWHLPCQPALLFIQFKIDLDNQMPL